ncbi:MAG: pyridoxine 5'-phosphate synthase [Candidatus Omnitrophica bacterium]|nr:pyridoxine 5'-phosphate synthase [Candidatus Omnitrophota bacterium]MBU4589483.1 pyridoxine 5'-phosphate synthase [Candidatus Omnitrophota bacterium]
MPELGVNVDHVATLREARGGKEPDPVRAAVICEQAGCDSIVAHLREDRRHINDVDIRALKKAVRTRFNLEMSINAGIVEIAKRVRPDQATLVPEKRQELTTEGGLSVLKNANRIGRVVEGLRKKSIDVSIFIDPDEREIRAAKDIGAGVIEIHTGRYADAKTKKAMDSEFERIKRSCEFALSLGFIVNAGHGLNYANTKRVARIKDINELNIGHSIISRAAFAGLYRAVRDMKTLCR